MNSLETIIKQLQNTYKNIDIHAIRFLDKTNNKWYCAFLKIHFTKMEEKSVNNEYFEIEQISGKFDKDELKIEHECRRIDDLESILFELKNNKIIIKGKEVDFINSTLTKQLEDNKFSIDQENAYKSQISESYDYRIFTINFTNGYGIYTILEKYVDLKKYNIDSATEFSAYLDINKMNYLHNIVFIFPLYYKIKQSIVKDDNIDNYNKVIDCIQIHKNILKDVKIKLDGTVNGRTFSKICQLSVPNNNQELIKSYFYSNIEISPSDYFNINILIGQLNAIKNYQLNGSEIIEKRPNYNIYIQQDIKSLLQGFKLFKAFEKFNYQVDTDRKYVEFVYNLLTLLNFSVINLGYFGKNYEQMMDKKIRYSADLIAYKEKINTLLVIDCTLSIGTIEKVDKLINTSNYLKKETKDNYSPVVFANECSSIIKTQAKENGVIIIDRNDIDEICNSINIENITKAICLFEQKLINKT